MHISMHVHNAPINSHVCTMYIHIHVPMDVCMYVHMYVCTYPSVCFVPLENPQQRAPQKTHFLFLSLDVVFVFGQC